MTLTLQEITKKLAEQYDEITLLEICLLYTSDAADE